MMISPELLAILICPETRTPLTLAEPAVVERLNAEIAAGRLKNRVGQTVERPLDGGLIRGDGRYLYPIVDDIPILLVDEALPLAAEASS